MKVFTEIGYKSGDCVGHGKLFRANPGEHLRGVVESWTSFDKGSLWKMHYHFSDFVGIPECHATMIPKSWEVL